MNNPIHSKLSSLAYDQAYHQVHDQVYDEVDAIVNSQVYQTVHRVVVEQLKEYRPVPIFDRMADAIDGILVWWNKY